MLYFKYLFEFLLVELRKLRSAYWIFRVLLARILKVEVFHCGKTEADKVFPLLQLFELIFDLFSVRILIGLHSDLEKGHQLALLLRDFFNEWVHIDGLLFILIHAANLNDITMLNPL